MRGHLLMCLSPKEALNYFLGVIAIDWTELILNG